MRHRPHFATLAGLLLLLAGCTPPAPPVAESGPVDFGRWRAGLSTPVADPIYPQYGNPGIDVLHYDLALAWEPGAKTLSGR